MHPKSVAKLAVCLLCQQKRTLCVAMGRALRLCISKVPSPHVCSSRARIALHCSDKMMSLFTCSAFALLRSQMPLVQPQKTEVKRWRWVLEWSVIQKYWQDCCQIRVLTLERKNKNVFQKEYLPSLVFGVVLNLTISEYSFSERIIFCRFKKLEQTTHPDPPPSPKISNLCQNKDLELKPKSNKQNNQAGPGFFSEL